jgi:PII-like signaling protein
MGGRAAVTHDSLKLTTYFGERDRAGDRFLADALMDCYARHGFQTSLILRGIEGFGAKHQLHTDRLLTLSEDLPVVSVAVDERRRIEAAVPEVVALSGDGLITLERARMDATELPETTKLTVYLGRGASHRAVVDLLHGHRIAGATVLLGVDGTAYGVRHRARFVGANARVPLMVISVGEGERIARVLPGLGETLFTVERVQVCKRDGRLLTEPETRADGWQKLMVYCSEQSRHHGAPLYHELVRRLRQAGASGATSLRGIWGYHGDHRPHGDTFWQLRRRVPVVTVVVDTPSNIRRWFEIVDELTAETGLVTSEFVPVFRQR